MQGAAKTSLLACDPKPPRRFATPRRRVRSVVSSITAAERISTLERASRQRCCGLCDTQNRRGDYRWPVSILARPEGAFSSQVQTSCARACENSKENNVAVPARPAGRPQHPASAAIVGPYHRIPVKIGGRLRFDDLKFVIPDGAKGGIVSPSRDRLFNVERPHVMLRPATNRGHTCSRRARLRRVRSSGRQSSSSTRSGATITSVRHAGSPKTLAATLPAPPGAAGLRGRRTSAHHSCAAGRGGSRSCLWTRAPSATQPTPRRCRVIAPDGWTS